MQYKVIKDANKIVKNCSYVVNDPAKYKKKWHEVFGNNNKICLELGMGRGDFIIDMAINYPNINFIGIEKFSSVLIRAIERRESYEKEKMLCCMSDPVEPLPSFCRLRQETQCAGHRVFMACLRRADRLSAKRFD